MLGGIYMKKVHLFGRLYWVKYTPFIGIICYKKWQPLVFNTLLVGVVVGVIYSVI